MRQPCARFRFDHVRTPDEYLFELLFIFLFQNIQYHFSWALEIFFEEFLYSFIVKNILCKKNYVYI